jgi:hypothetical protein
MLNSYYKSPPATREPRRVEAALWSLEDPLLPGIALVGLLIDLSSIRFACAMNIKRQAAADADQFICAACRRDYLPLLIRLAIIWPLVDESAC